MSAAERDPFARLLWFAPVIFVAHFLEEAPGFVEWFNSHVSRGITPRLFWQVNLTALVITIVVSIFASLDRSEISATVATGWLSFLFGANAVVHIAASIVDRRYVPGLFTALLMYVPYYAAVLWYAKRRGVRSGGLIATALACAAPMLIHGYRVLFLGTRLF